MIGIISKLTTQFKQLLSSHKRTHHLAINTDGTYIVKDKAVYDEQLSSLDQFNGRYVHALDTSNDDSCFMDVYYYDFNTDQVSVCHYVNNHPMRTEAIPVALLLKHYVCKGSASSLRKHSLKLQRELRADRMLSAIETF